MEKSVKHVSIPVFVVHEGCPNTCLFCNQKKISGCESFSLEPSRRTIDTHLSTLRGDEEVQIAFFGGSFTAIEREKMLSLLSLSDEYVEKGLVKSVRLSTRPDAVDGEILDILSRHHVSDIELGIQSLDDEVLLKNARGHTAECAVDAMKRVVSHGFSLTGQMMTGMYSSRGESEVETAEKIVECGAVSCRIYPTVVFRDTGLFSLVQKGEFVPLTLEESVERTYGVYKIFRENGVKVLRIGLCSNDGVRGDDAVSVYHEAWGELILSREARDRLEIELVKSGVGRGDRVKITVPRRETSRFIGHGKQNKVYLEEKYGIELKFFGGDAFGLEIL